MEKKIDFLYFIYFMNLWQAILISTSRVLLSRIFKDSFHWPLFSSYRNPLPLAHCAYTYFNLLFLCLFRCIICLPKNYITRRQNHAGDLISALCSTKITKSSWLWHYQLNLFNYKWTKVRSSWNAVCQTMLMKYLGYGLQKQNHWFIKSRD